MQTKVVVRNSKDEVIVNGNCYPAVIASLLDLPITEVPNVEVFYKDFYDNSIWQDVMNTWLRGRGYAIVPADEYRIFHNDDDSFEANQERIKMSDGLYLVSGPSPRGVNHICIYQGGEMIHDPHPTQEGLLELKWFEKLVRVPPTKECDDWIKVSERLPDTHRVRFMDRNGAIWEGNYGKDSGAWYAYHVNNEIPAKGVAYWQPQTHIPKNPRSCIPVNMDEWCDAHHQYYKDECHTCEMLKTKSPHNI